MPNFSVRNAVAYNTPGKISSHPPLKPQVRVLVEEGHATIAIKDHWGSTPLDEARRVGAVAIVSYLETRMSGADVALSVDKHRQMQTGALVAACGSGDVCSLRKLLLEGRGRASGCSVGLLLAVANRHQVGQQQKV